MKNLTMFFSLSVFCSMSLSQGRHEHEAHTHGLAEMTVVYDNHQLIIELKTPAVNMLGFEDGPLTEEKQNVVRKVSALVNDPMALFVLTPNCESTGVDTDIPFVDELTTSDKGHSGSHHHDDDQNHKDIKLAYQWVCTSLPKIQLQLFDLFPGFESINSQWVVNNKQGFKRLNNKVFTLDFSK